MLKHILIAVLVGLATILAAQQTSITVYGNCGMCQDRIEQAARSVIGVEQASWDAGEQTLVVEHALFFSVDELHQRMAAIGHDTDLVKADDTVYGNLHGCCLYRDDTSADPTTTLQDDGEHAHRAITVYGNCGMCSDRITKAAMTVRGVDNAIWDEQTKVLSLYGEEDIDLSAVHIAVAAIGHDTDLVKADDTVYDNLHGCCLYRDPSSKDLDHTSTSDHGGHSPELGHDGHDHTGEIAGMIFEKTATGDLQSVIGANVGWVGDQTGTATDVDGHWSLPERLSGDQRIVVSYVGYGNDTIEVGDQRLIAVTLTSNHILNEVEIKYRKRSTQISFINPIKTQSISEKELCKAACCNLSESFETNPGVDVSMTDAVSGTRKIEMLGLAGPNIQVMRENMPYIRGLAAIQGMEYTPGPWIEGMSLNMGTGSVVNGPESITGQINVEIKKPEVSERLYLNFFGNLAGRLEANLNTTQKVSKRWSTATLLHAKTLRQENDNNNDGFLDLPMSDVLIAMNRWKYKGDNGIFAQVGVKGTYVDKTGGELPSQAGETRWTSNMLTQRIEGWSKIGKVWADRPYASVGLQLSAMHHDQRADFGGTTAFRRNYDATHTNLYANLIYQTIIGTTDHVFKTGASMVYDDIEEQILETTYQRSERMPGAFAEYQYVGSNRWSMVAGLRVDHHNNFGTFVTPRLHLKYSPTENQAFRLAVGRGQRTASIFAEHLGLFASNRDIVIRGDNTDSPYGLVPDVGWNLGINYTVETELLGMPAVWGIDYYYTTFSSQIVADYDQSRTIEFYALDGIARSHSVQTQIDITPVEGLDIRMAYRYNDPRTTYRDGLRLNPLTAQMRAFVNAEWAIGKGWIIDATVNRIGTKRLPDTDSSPEIYRLDARSPAFTTVNAQITKKFGDYLDIYLGGENILNFMQEVPIVAADDVNSPYFDSSMIWGPILGANVYIGLRYRLF